MEKFDFLVIGSGPAGQKAAIQAAKLGKSVAMFDRRNMLGGVSVHQGTIPSKTLREAALYLTGRDQRGLYGHSYRLKENLTIDDLMQRLNITLEHETEVIHNQLMRNGVRLVEGSATFKDDHVIVVENDQGGRDEFHGKKILISTGSRPHRPDNVPFNDKTILDSDGILNIESLPASMTIVGAGVIGVEYASIFSTLDTRVTLIDGRDTILGFLDREIVDELCHYMRKNNITLRLNETVADIETNGNGKISLHLESGKRVTSDMVMYAAGRMGSTWALSLDNAGVKTGKHRRIDVNENYQTNVPHIYAAGDVIGFPSLASTSMEQGRMVARHAFGETVKSHPALFPFGIYSVPEISMVGMTEQELMEKGIAYEVGIARLHETARGQIRGIQEGILKMMFALEDRRLLGVHVIGEGATEMVHIGQAVLVLGGTLDYFLDNVFNYPTLAEAYKAAALDAWNRMQ
jgi:NAD(P) transhydrogenase